MKQLCFICVILLLLYTFHLDIAGVVSFLGKDDRIALVFLVALGSGSFVLCDLVRAVWVWYTKKQASVYRWPW